ncbi:holin family protein [Thermoactinomyces sp. DSM 45892]|uniref:phage holin family protein n=1 Tax=Thermoactinomyces sp. DSM 45892 TaxID=1882753 RepID=UPI0021011801|nr:phage holin family protein [Thermoactinomyces sp. DSM 45892]
MDKFYAGFVFVIGVIGSYLLGGWDLSMQALGVLVVFDYITGMSASIHEGKLNSHTGYKGIMKKVVIFIVVGAAYWVGKLAMGDGGKYLRDGTIVFYAVNELISIIENVSRMGIPVPDILVRTIENVKNREKKVQEDIPPPTEPPTNQNKSA